MLMAHTVITGTSVNGSSAMPMTMGLAATSHAAMTPPQGDTKCLPMP